jgi:hypothetical protein
VCGERLTGFMVDNGQGGIQILSMQQKKNGGPQAAAASFPDEVGSLTRLSLGCTA